MTHIIRILLTALLLVASTSAPAGKTISSPPENHVQAMNQLNHWIGLWHGKGWGMAGPGQRETFEITERVTRKLGGSVLLVEGQGTTTTAEGDMLVTHDAIGLLSWDPEQKRYNFRTHDLRGQARDATLELGQDGRMHWGFRDEHSDALLRFDIHVENDTWRQSGRISPDNGETWYPMLEMTLHKQGPTSEHE